MKVLLINPPYQTLTSNLGVGHQVPLGLLMVGGALIDAGLDVELVDAEALHLSIEAVSERARASGADVVMTGHAGSTPAHPVCVRMLRQIKRDLPRVVSVYGGVFPTYHAREILESESAVDVIVRGEGEATAVELMRALREKERGGLRGVAGIAFRDGAEIALTEEAEPITDLDHYRAGWELIDDWARYGCFGLGRAAIVQYSRGCPHRCTYCGQHGFWRKWRRRDPVRVADEIARLNREHGVKFITLADENPTTDKREWRRLLEEIAARKVDVHFFATIRASDIVRDADMLDLYRRAGLLYILLGVDATDPALLERVRKRSTTSVDLKACQLLRQHGIRSIVAQIVGLGEDTWAGFRRARRALEVYDGDLLNVMYATPHSWTQFARESVDRLVVQEDQRCWDYRHQVLGLRWMRPWELFAAVKVLELLYHARPRRLWRMLFDPDRFLRAQFRWTALHTGAVWLGEIVDFVFRVRFAARARRLGERAGREYVPLTVAKETRAAPLRTKKGQGAVVNV